jgi:hypothetical protein
MPPLQALWVFFGEIDYGENNPMSLSWTFLAVDQVLQKPLLCLDLYDSKPHIATKKYSASIYSDE